MEFYINTKKLIESLKFSNILISGSANSYNSPLSGVLIEAEQDKITFHASNLQNKGIKTISDTNIYTCIEPGKVLVSSKTLLGALTKLKELSINIKMVDSNVLVIKAGKFQTQINTLDEKSYPIENFSLIGYNETKVNSELFLNIASKVLPNVVDSNQTNEKNPAITGVYLKNNEETQKLTIYGTDRFKASRLIVDKMNGEFEFIIPSNSIKLICDVLKNSELEKDNKIVFYSKNNSLVVEINENKIYTKLIEATFPDISKIFEFNEKEVEIFEIKKSNLTDVIERGMYIVAQQSNPKINIKVENNKMLINFQTFEIGSMDDEVELLNSVNSTFDIAININYLMSVLRVIKGEVITFVNKNDVNTPLIIFDKNEPDLKQIISKFRS